MPCEIPQMKHPKLVSTPPSPPSLPSHLLNNGGAVTSNNDLLEVVNNQLVHPIGAQGGPHDGRKSLGGLNVAQSSTVDSLHVLVASLKHTSQAGGRI